MARSTFASFPATTGTKNCILHLCLHSCSKGLELGNEPFPPFSSGEPAIWRGHPAGVVDCSGFLGFVSFVLNNLKGTTMPWMQKKSENLSAEGGP